MVRCLCLLPVVVLGLSACLAVEGGGGPRTLGPLPASFAGDLPCADCEAIGHRLDLYPDRSYVLRQVYRGRANGVFDDVGRWDYASDGGTLVLQGGGQAPWFYTVEGRDRLRQLDRDGRPIESALNYTLVRLPGPFVPLEPRLTLRGSYTYLADAGLFTECRTGRRFPVAMEGDNGALERAYLDARPGPGAPLLVTVEGSLAPRPPMEGPRSVPHLVPERLVGVFPGEHCPPAFATLPLEGTRWQLTRLGADLVSSPDRQRTAYVVFSGEEARVGGSDGCNLLGGVYARNGSRMSLSQLASTLMACTVGMEEAQRFTAALEATVSWRVAGPALDLFGADGSLLVRFEAGAAP